MPARALRRRVPPLRALAAGGRPSRARRRRAEPRRSRCATASSATRAGRTCRRRWRGGSCGWWTASPTSTTTSTTRCGPECSTRTTCRATRSRCWATRARGASTRWCTTWSSTRETAGDIVQGEEAGAAMSALRDFMFEHVYLGETARREHAKIATVVRTLFDHYVEQPGGDRRRGGRRPRAGRHGLPRRDDRPLLHPRVRGAERAGGVRLLMALYTEDSKERVRDAVDMVALVETRVDLRRAGADVAHGPVPVPRGADAVVQRQPGQEGLLLLRLPGVGGRVPLRPGDGGGGLQGRDGVAGATGSASSWSGRRRTRRRRSAGSGASGCSSCWSARRASTSATCGTRRRRSRRARTWRSEGWATRCCASSGWGTRRARGTRC